MSLVQETVVTTCHQSLSPVLRYLFSSESPVSPVIGSIKSLGTLVLVI